MKYSIKEDFFKSTDGVHDIHYSLYAPTEIKSVMVIVHGMYEYKERYSPVASFLAENGIAVFTYDQLGHGKSVNDVSEKGWFGEKKGVSYIQGDVLKAVQMVKDMYPEKKVTLFGHSMGSFIVRYFIVRNPDVVDFAIFSGTSGGNSAIDIAIAVSSFVSKMNGSKHVNNLLNTLAMGGNNKKFEKMGETSPSAWLTRDKAIQKQCDSNNFIFTVQGFCDMFKMLKDIASNSWYKNYPKKIPTYLMSGEDDPIGDFGKGVKKVYMKLKVNKVENVDLKLYPECRHEPLNELNREDVYKDILNWIINKLEK